MTDQRLLSRRDVMLVAAGTGLTIAEPVLAGRALRTPVRLSELAARDMRSGRSVRLFRDIVRNRVVVMSFFFTGCSTICPLQSTSLSRAQPMLAALLGSKAVFVSVSLDWWGDTPAAIQKFAQRHNAGPHWHFLKAPPVDVDRLRRGLEAYDSNRDNHPPAILIGKLSAPSWSRLTGAMAPSTLAAEVRAWSS